MSTVLTQDQIETAAKDLDMPVDEVQKLYERAISLNGQFGVDLDQFKEYALKTNGGGAMTAADDEDEEYDEGDKKMSKKEMIETLEGLTVSEFKELEELMSTVKRGKYEDDEYSEEEMMKKRKKGDDEYSEDDDMKQMKKKQEDLETLVMAQTKAMEGLVSALSGNQQQTSLNSAVTDFLSSLPRQQANGFVTQQTKENDNQEIDPIMAKLKEIEEKVSNSSSVGQNDIYKMFTSKTLNQGKQ